MKIVFDIFNNVCFILFIILNLIIKYICYNIGLDIIIYDGIFEKKKRYNLKVSEYLWFFLERVLFLRYFMNYYL